MTKLNLSLVVDEQWLTIKKTLSDLNVDYSEELTQSLLLEGHEGRDAPVNATSLFHFMNLLAPKLTPEQFHQLASSAARQNAINAIRMMEFEGCQSVQQALESYCQQATYVMTDTQLCVEPFVGETWFKCFRTYSSEPWFEFAESYGINLYKELVAQFSGTNWKPSKLSLASSTTDHLDFANFLPSPTIFQGREFYGFKVEQDVLGLPLKLKPYTSTESIFRNTDVNFIQALRYLTLSSIRDSVVTLEMLSQITKLSQRTIQRRLQESGTNFQSFYDDLIVEESKRRLTDPGNKVTDIGYQLGYSSPPSFIRFFKNKVGVTPKQYQKQCRN